MKMILNNKYYLVITKIFTFTLIFVLIGSFCIKSTAFQNKILEDKNNNLYCKTSTTDYNLKKINIVNNNINGNIVITSGAGNFINPQITQDSNKNIIVAYTQEVDSNDCRLGWSYSLDSGENWEIIECCESSYSIYNDIAWVDGDYFTGLFGVYNDLKNCYESFYVIRDISDPSTWQFFHWINCVMDLTYTCISDYGWLEGQYYQTSGPVSFNMQHFLYTDYKIKDCPTSVIYEFDEEGMIQGGEMTFDGQRYLKTAPAYDPDMSNEYMKSHYTWSFYNETSGLNQIVWKKIIPIEGDSDSTDIEYTPYRAYIGNGEHPSITHDDNNVVIVYMENEFIVCAYSNNDGETWEKTTIGKGAWPDICSTNGIFRCAYSNNNNLYIIESSDGGATWGNPVQINELNGSVVEEENSIDIHCSGVVWTGQVDGFKNIFYAPNNENPKIEIKDVLLGYGVTVVIENVGNSSAYNIDCEIIISDAFMIVGKNTKKTIDIPDNQIVQVKTGFIFGFGQASINIIVEDIKIEKKGTVFGPFII